VNVYVASKFENQSETKYAQKLLEQAGHSITYDWTQNDETRRDEPGFLAACAENDFAGVAKADALVLLGAPLMRGAYVELGIALAYDIPVVVVGRHECENIFLHLKSDNILFCDSIRGAVDAVNYLASPPVRGAA
jgi:nucleoside 2-deoxyribosyltransferase